MLPTSRSQHVGPDGSQIEILEPEDPAKLYKDFMHRAPDPDALMRRDGLIT